MERAYVIALNTFDARRVGLDARDAVARFLDDVGPSASVFIQRVIVEATGEVVPRELWGPR